MLNSDVRVNVTYKAQFFLRQWVVVEYLNDGHPQIVETGLDSNRQATSLALQFRQETKGVPTAA
jgi:hypothetical protein